MGTFVKGLRTIIGDGSSTLLWTDNWLGTPLSCTLTGPLPRDSLSVKVSSIIDNNRSWDLSSIPFPLPAILVSRIIAIPLSRYSNLADSVSWINSVDGSFSSKLAYDLLTPDIPTSNVDVDALWIWKLHTLPKIRSFIWLTCLEKLPTRLSLQHKNISSDGLCFSCFEEESCRHLLWECPRSLLFWKDLGLVPSKLHHNTTIPSWIRSNARRTNVVHGIPFGCLFLFGCWTIWYVINSRLFSPGKPLDPPRDCISHALEFFHLGKQIPFAVNKAPSVITWSKPGEGMFKLNIDGASKGNPGLAGCGGVLRDHLGNWVAGFARKIPWATNTVAELWALRDGLELIQFSNHPCVIIESDSQFVCSLMTTSSNIDRNYCSLVNDCRWLFSRI